jgi:hypothetical protein
MEDTQGEYLITSVLWLTIDVTDIKQSWLLCSVGGLAPKDVKDIVSLREYIRHHSLARPRSLTALHYLTDSFKMLRR